MKPFLEQIEMNFSKALKRHTDIDLGVSRQAKYWNYTSWAIKVRDKTLTVKVLFTVRKPFNSNRQGKEQWFMGKFEYSQNQLTQIQQKDSNLKIESNFRVTWAKPQDYFWINDSWCKVTVSYHIMINLLQNHCSP